MAPPTRRPPDKATALADRLTQGTWTHDHPIGFRKARNMGLPVLGDMPDDFYRLMALFPQPIRRRHGVEYFPTPYRPPADAREKDG